MGSQSPAIAPSTVPRTLGSSSRAYASKCGPARMVRTTAASHVPRTCDAIGTSARVGAGKGRNTSSRTARSSLAREALERLEGPLQALTHVDGGLVAEQRAGRADVGQRVAHVAGACRAVLGFELLARELADVAEQLVEGRALVAGDVDHLARELLVRRRGEQVRLHRVVDVAEVAGLLAVAEDDGALLAQGRGDELRHD